MLTCIPSSSKVPNEKEPNHAIHEKHPPPFEDRLVLRYLPLHASAELHGLVHACRRRG